MTFKAAWVVVVAIAIGLAAGTSLVLVSVPSTGGSACVAPGYDNRSPPLSVFSFGPVREAAAGMNHWYNITLASAEMGLELGNLKIQIETQSGLLVTPSPNWTLTVTDSAGAWLGTYSWIGPINGTWANGGTEPLSPGQQFSLFTASERLSGDDLVASVFGSGSCPPTGTFTSTSFW